jgi:ABC-type branched-subunit amino acid transport system substrate-binding protein
MRVIGRLLVTGLVLLSLASPAHPQLFGGSKPTGPAAGAPAAPIAPREDKPAQAEAKTRLPTLRLGAVLPLTGPGAWFGKQIRQGIDLAIADLNAPPASGGANTREEEAVTIARRATEEGMPSPGVTLALEAADVQPLDAKKAADEFTRLAGMGAVVVFTASATPTLAMYPLASGRNVLLVHQGVVTGRFPATSKVLVHTRPSITVQVDALLAQAAEQKVGRLGLLAAGDEFGKAVRAAVSARWRERGASLAVEESLTPEASDLTSRIRQVVRAAPDALVLGYRGVDLGDMATRLREGGYRGGLYLLDDDPEARLAAGPALQGAVLVSDAFAPKAGPRAERFAEAYKKKFGDPPSRYAASAYDAVALVAAAIRVMVADGRPAPGGARLRETLLSLRDVPSVYGGTVMLRADGTLARPLALFTVDDGKTDFVKALPAERS